MQTDLRNLFETDSRKREIWRVCVAIAEKTEHLGLYAEAVKWVKPIIRKTLPTRAFGTFEIRAFP